MENSKLLTCNPQNLLENFTKTIKKFKTVKKCEKLRKNGTEFAKLYKSRAHLIEFRKYKVKISKLLESEAKFYKIT